MLPEMAPYLAPEISRGALPSPASDVYSAGVILFELLCGRKPYQADTTVAMALKHAGDDVPSVKALNPSVPTVLDRIVAKAMAKNPDERYSSAAAMLSDLRMFQDALRFGKTLTWPLRSEPEVNSAPASVAPVPVAAVTKTRRAPDPIDDDDDDGTSSDIPIWLKMSLAFFAGLVVVMFAGWAYLNMSKPQMVDVPDLKGLSVIDANSKVSRINLGLRIAGHEINEQIPPEHIIRQELKPGDKAYVNSKIGVTVSSGSRFVEVPDLHGLTLDKARDVLASANLVLDDHVVQAPSNDLDVGLITWQNPGHGSKRERMTHVKVKVSSGQAASEKASKDSNKKYVYTVKIHLSDIDRPVTVRVDMTDSRGTTTVHEAVHQPNDDISILREGFGSEATFRIFYDGDLVKEVTKQADEASDSGDDTDTGQ
jgi:serine/threonine-protein kinase